MVVLKNDAHAAAQAGNVAASQASQVETRDAPFARDELQVGIKDFQQRAFAAPDATDQVNEFPLAHLQIEVGEHQFAALHELAWRTTAERVVGVIDVYMAESDDGLLVHCLMVLVRTKVRKNPVPHPATG